MSSWRKLSQKLSPKSSPTSLPSDGSADSSPSTSSSMTLSPPQAPRPGISQLTSISSLSLATESSVLTIRGIDEIPPSPTRPIVASSSTARAISSLDLTPLTSEDHIPPLVSPSTGWWSKPAPERISRPWKDPSPVPQRKQTVPPEQTEAYLRTRTSVQRATAKRAWKGAKVIVHDVLEVGADVVALAPVPGLQEAVSSLLKIWGFVEQVESNRMACLHLVERCANLLSSVEYEIERAGPDVYDSLQEPLQKLNGTFRDIEHFMQKQAERPFIKRYLKRGAIADQIKESHEKLNDNFSIFNMAVQIRMFHEIQELHNEHPLPIPPPSPLSLKGELSQSLSSASPTSRLKTHHYERLTQEMHLDDADMRTIIRQALGSNSDAHLIEVLQVTRPEMAEAIKTLQRALEDPRLSVPARRSPSVNSLVFVEDARQVQFDEEEEEDDADDNKLHREFIEEEIGALKRLSGERPDVLPPWTITRWEIDRDKQIGLGYFSEVFQGVWKDKVVAIKVLQPTTPANLFLHEAHIWQQLDHPYVLKLLGASSTSSNPPWFLVSPYMKNGSLIQYMKDHPDGTHHIRFIHEIAVGMKYLHGQDVLHGDLKACNVLIDDNLHCVISDFGQSELKSEVYRLSGAMPPRGTLRWMAPETLVASYGHLNPAVDIYAYAISSVEILTNGELWLASLDDITVRHMILEEGARPHIPSTVPGLSDLIRRCWATEPAHRPSFARIAGETRRILDKYGGGNDITPRRKPLELQPESSQEHSPSLVPVGELQHTLPDASPLTPLSDPSSDEEFRSLPSLPPGWPRAPLPNLGGLELDIGSTSSISSRTSSVYSSSLENSQLMRPRRHDDGYESPTPSDPVAAERRNERRYRVHLAHPWHETLKLPLWSPSSVQIGDVGFHNKAHGTGNFIRFFNAFDPVGTASSAFHYFPALGHVETGIQRESRRGATQFGFEWGRELASKLFGFSQDTRQQHLYDRTYPFRLRAGHKRALVVAESTVYQYMHDLRAAKEWFTQYRDAIVETYRHQHPTLTKEDVILVIGTLDSQDYALFVNHYHPDGNVKFNVYTERKKGKPWGVWTTDTNLPPTSAGPHYDDSADSDSARSASANKVSLYDPNTSRSHTLVLARLRFKPDSTTPTHM